MFAKIAIFLSAIVLASAQLSFRTDANSNMYSIQTPSFQSTFTRYFGQPSGAIEAAEARPQAQFAPAPAAGYNYAAPQPQQFDPAQAAAYQQQTAAYQQQPAAYQQPAAQYQHPAAQYQQPAAQYQQPADQYQQPAQQQFSAQDIAAYFQQQEASNQQQQPQQDYGQQQPLLAQQQVGAQPSRYSQPQAAAPVSIQFSPSNEVSSVKFSSGALKYNF